MPPSDYYALLGVARDATEMEIRSAYGRQALAQQASGASTPSALLQEALATLTDPAKRSAYDATLDQQLAPPEAGVAAAPGGDAPRRTVVDGIVGLLKRFPILIAIGLFSLGGYLFRDVLSGDVGDLKVGDCFDIPAGDVTGKTLKDVQHHPCADPHGAEMFLITSVPGSGDAYPGVEAFRSVMTAQCVPAFGTYTGLDYDADPTYDIFFLYPSADSWKDGDREVLCSVFRIDEKPIKGSLRAAR